jgi:hypothetical protein
MKKRQRTEKSKYKHESTGDYCTCAAYIAEIMCRKNAENKNVGSLPYKFWNKKPWDWTFKKQLFMANKLLKEFSEEAVVKAINSDKFKKIFSLNHPNALSIIREMQEYLDSIPETNQVIEVKEDPKIRKSSYGNKKRTLKSLSGVKNGKKETEE